MSKDDVEGKLNAFMDDWYAELNDGRVSTQKDHLIVMDSMKLALNVARAEQGTSCSTT